MTEEKYNNIFTGIYKEAKFLGGIEAEKLDIEDWRKRCNELYDKGKQAREDIDKEIEKLSETKRLFRRIDPNNTDCNSIAYRIKNDCKEKPEKCPVEVKKLIVKELEEDIHFEERQIQWIKEDETLSLSSGETQQDAIKRHEEDIKKTKELIEKLKK